MHEKISRTVSHASGTIVGSTAEDALEQQKRVDALMANPLIGKSQEELFRDVDEWCERIGLTESRDLFYKAALVAQDRANFERLTQLSEEEKDILRREVSNPYLQSKTLYWTVFMCSMSAVVQGMDQSVINGANLYWPEQFGIGSSSTSDTLLLGLVASSPYLCASLLACWLTHPLNHYFGRRGTIFISTLCAGLGCIWNAVTNSWQHLFVSRLFLGFGIGPKSATTPTFAAEIAPARIRGALAMQWQTWTAFGICLGTVSSLIFKDVNDVPNITGLNWRLMLGSAALPAIFVCAQVYFVPESPRWLMKKGRHLKAWEAFLKFRRTPLQSAIDMYYTSKCIEIEEEMSARRQRSVLVELVTVPRNRRAMLASCTVMFMQQFCGINAIAYYSSTIFQEAGQGVTTALLGLINWVGSFPAFFTIDRWGRRSLLLFTLPFLSLFMWIAGSGFWLETDQQQLAMVMTGVYLFAAFYGPVRELGMSLATATTWFFNFLNALVFPLQIRRWTPAGAFYWFGGWNAVLWVMVLMFCPETKAFTLEELDEVFSMSTARQARYGLASPAFWFRKYVLRQNIQRTALHHYHPSEHKDQPKMEHREIA
ncbi:hypothetical protein Rhopal_005970-T1 [Rhodotorula paludigena]|uniref:Major facilitator superfamily (MFS) profile domain-containing protein n=1 Tax=Rhodotorula paludigena TaxID=86838 RepID=A0AAV5GTU4_9BASI|nr:hypothetical protein Rhopal_005970-T1 [Rhodotorula paludigena]